MQKGMIIRVGGRGREGRVLGGEEGGGGEGGEEGG